VISKTFRTKSVIVFLLVGFSLCGGMWLFLGFLRHSEIEHIRRYGEVESPETGYAFPPVSDIDRMTAVLNPRQANDPVLQFDIPSKCWTEIIEALSPSQYDPHPAPWTGLGSLTIHIKGGARCEVDLFEVLPDSRLPGTPLIGAFAVESDLNSRKCYRGGYTQNLTAAIARAYAASEKNKSSSRKLSRKLGRN
jgi:hypothetical protein